MTLTYSRTYNRCNIILGRDFKKIGSENVVTLDDFA